MLSSRQLLPEEPVLKRKKWFQKVALSGNMSYIVTINFFQHFISSVRAWQIFLQEIKKHTEMIAKRKCQKEEQLKRYSNVQSFARIIQTTESK